MDQGTDGSWKEPKAIEETGASFKEAENRKKKMFESRIFKEVRNFATIAIDKGRGKINSRKNGEEDSEVFQLLLRNPRCFVQKKEVQ